MNDTWYCEPRGAERQGEVVFGERTMFSLKMLPLLLLFCMQLSRAFPVPSESTEEKNIEVVQVNWLSGGWLICWLLGTSVSHFLFLVKTTRKKFFGLFVWAWTPHFSHLKGSKLGPLKGRHENKMGSSNLGKILLLSCLQLGNPFRRNDFVYKTKGFSISLT